MIASIPLLKSYLNFFLNRILTCEGFPQIFELFPQINSIIIFYLHLVHPCGLFPMCFATKTLCGPLLYLLRAGCSVSLFALNVVILTMTEIIKNTRKSLAWFRNRTNAITELCWYLQLLCKLLRLYKVLHGKNLNMERWWPDTLSVHCDRCYRRRLKILTESY